jgi:choline-phosphate cytidylyltransferase
LARLSICRRHALHLRQAKLSFPSVRLVVGVFDDSSESVASYAPPLVERAELLRHCRWVDEVLSGAPDTIDTKFLAAHQIDYVAVEEGASLDPTFGKDRLRAYERLKELGQ